MNPIRPSLIEPLSSSFIQENSIRSLSYLWEGSRQFISERAQNSFLTGQVCHIVLSKKFKIACVVFTVVCVAARLFFSNFVKDWIALHRWKGQKNFFSLEKKKEAKRKMVECYRQGLTSLCLERLELTTLPELSGTYERIYSLDLSHNCFSTLPEVIQKLPKLAQLNLSHNNISSLPDWFFDLPQGIEINLTGNSFSLEELHKIQKRNQRCLNIRLSICDLRQKTFLNFNIYNSILHAAVEHAPPDEFKKFLKTPGIDVNVVNPAGQTPLMRACILGREEIIALLLQHPKTDPNIKDLRGRSAIDFTLDRPYSSKESHIKVVEDFLYDRLAAIKHGFQPIDLKAKNQAGKTLLQVLDELGFCRRWFMLAKEVGRDLPQTVRCQKIVTALLQEGGSPKHVRLAVDYSHR